MPRCFLAKQCNSKGYRPPDPDNRKWNSNEGSASTKVITNSPRIIIRIMFISLQWYCRMTAH